MARPLAASLIVVLCALLLERILRLIDLVATQGGPLGPVLQMALNLIPHYLGLALPAAFFISMFVVIARLADDSELEAIMAVGRSLRRIEVPLVLIAVIFAMLSVALYGFLQPYTRYAYRAIFNMVKHTGWTGELPQGAFVNAGNGMTIFAEIVDLSGRRMTKIFIHEQRPKSEIITTAERGELNFNNDHSELWLTLYKGRQIRREDTKTSVIEFERYNFSRDFSQQAYLFRPRGGDEREMTLIELYEQLRDGSGEISPDTMRAELHGRLARAASIIFLPFLAFPMGLAAKRGRRGPGLLIASIILVMFHHSLQFGEGLVDLGRVGPLIGIWGPLIIFAIFCLVATWRADVKAGGGPFDAAFAAIERMGGALRRILPSRSS